MIRFVVSVLLLATPLAVLHYWVCGCLAGFHIGEKISAKAKRLARRIAIAILLFGGGGAAVGVGSMRGCITLPQGLGVASNSRPRSPERATTHSLGKLIPPPPELLFRLRMETEKVEDNAMPESGNARWTQVRLEGKRDVRISDRAER